MERREHRPRIADVARAAGVSKTAVSFAFNSPDRLAPDTARLLKATLNELGECRRMLDAAREREW